MSPCSCMRKPIEGQQIIDEFAFDGLLRDHKYDNLAAILDVHAYFQLTITDIMEAKERMARGELDGFVMLGTWLQIRSNGIGVRLISMLARHMRQYAKLHDPIKRRVITKEAALNRIETFIIPAITFCLWEAAAWFNEYFETDQFQIQDYESLEKTAISVAPMENNASASLWPVMEPPEQPITSVTPIRSLGMNVTGLTPVELLEQAVMDLSTPTMVKI